MPDNNIDKKGLRFVFSDLVKKVPRKIKMNGKDATIGLNPQPLDGKGVITAPCVKESNQAEMEAVHKVYPKYITDTTAVKERASKNRFA